jgi:nitric oxide reductase subunit B
MVRAVRPALRQGGDQRPLLMLFLISTVAIAVFYMAALGYGRRTNLAVAEYWRWWVVHLWVEGFFEVFATVVIAFLFARLKLVAIRSAAQSSLLAATIFLSGGIIGTLHHLYFSGTPTFVLALGSVFSALEVVPLLFVGFEAWENLRLSRRQAVGTEVPLADLLLRVRGVLESGRRRAVRLHDQSADRAATTCRD